MKLTAINQAIISQAKSHFDENCNDEATRNLVLSTYFAEEYDLTNDEASLLAGGFDSTDSDYFWKWYYFNHVNPIVIS